MSDGLADDWFFLVLGCVAVVIATFATRAKFEGCHAFGGDGWLGNAVEWFVVVSWWVMSIGNVAFSLSEILR